MVIVVRLVIVEETVDALCDWWCENGSTGVFKVSCMRLFVSRGGAFCGSCEILFLFDN